MRRSEAGLELLQRPEHVEAALWRRLRFEGEGRCREALFNKYAEFARRLARQEFRRRPPHGLQRADFEQLAYGGLLEAIDRFDPLLGAPFDAFARHRIKGAIADGAAKSSEVAAQYDTRRRLEQERVRSLLPARTLQAADPIADLTELAVALAIGAITASATLEGTRCDSGALGVYESVAWRDMKQRVCREIERLPEKEGMVMRQHYINDLPFLRIAAMMGLSKGRVAQLHKAALARLRGRILTEE